MVTTAQQSTSHEPFGQSGGNTRIHHVFAELASHGRKGLIPFVTAGHPHPSCTVSVLHALAKAGADIIELGIPFSDPMADGPVIQRASEDALQHGMCLSKVLDTVQAFRSINTQTPIVLMGYANPIEQMGLDVFAEKAKLVGVDGVLVVDYPPEESQALAATLHACGIDLICLLAPTSSKARITQVLNMASGFIYYVALNGVTGAAHLDAVQVTSQLPELRQQNQTPVAVGFGIRDAASACAIAHQADAVVIGSALVKCLQDSLQLGATTSRAATISANTAPQFVLEDLASGVADAAYAFLHPIRQALDAKFHSHS